MQGKLFTRALLPVFEPVGSHVFARPGSRFPATTLLGYALEAVAKSSPMNRYAFNGEAGGFSYRNPQLSGGDSKWDAA